MVNQADKKENLLVFYIKVVITILDHKKLLVVCELYFDLLLSLIFLEY